MKRRLTESDVSRIIKKVLKEDNLKADVKSCFDDYNKKVTLYGIKNKIPMSCKLEVTSSGSYLANPNTCLTDLQKTYTFETLRNSDEAKLYSCIIQKIKPE